MESREGMNSGVTVISAEAPSSYHVATRTENLIQFTGTQPLAPSPGSAGLAGTLGKKKRGRPRKCPPEGAIARAFSPMPISSSAPPAASKFSADNQGPPPATGAILAEKPRKGRPIASESKPLHRVVSENLGELVAFSSGENFTPHMIDVNAGEDVAMKIISFSQQGPRAICIISAAGSISNVTLGQQDSSGGTLTYEGRFEILTLSGSFTPTELQGSRTSRAGSMSITLSSSDGRLIGGVLAGLLIAASPVQVVVGSFLLSDRKEPKPKNHKSEPKLTKTATGSAAMPHASNVEHRSFNPHSQAAESPHNAPLYTLQTENWANMPTAQDADINMSLQGE